MSEVLCNESSPTQLIVEITIHKMKMVNGQEMIPYSMERPIVFPAHCLEEKLYGEIDKLKEEVG